MKRQSKKADTLRVDLAMAYIMSMVMTLVLTMSHAALSNDETPKRSKARKKPTAAKK